MKHPHNRPSSPLLCPCFIVKVFTTIYYSQRAFGKKNASDHFGSTILKFCACVPRLGLNNFLLANIPYLAVRAVVTKPFEIFYVRQLNLHAKKVINLFNNFWDSFLILEPLDSRTLCLFHFFCVGF